MTLPRSDELPGLLGFQPPRGVMSVYLSIDHGDRGGGWHTALKDELRAALAGAEGADHDSELALRATAERVLGRFPDPNHPPEGRGVIGFAEISAKNGEDRWFESPVGPRSTARVAVSSRPLVLPLVELLDDNRPRGVVAVSGEKGRLFEWSGGDVEEVVDEQILSTGDWRERKAQRNVDVPSGQAVSTSGHDRYEQRMEHHRQNFVKHVAEEVGRLADERGWEELIGFGEAKRLAELKVDLPDGCLVHVDDANVIPEPTHRIAERLSELKDLINRSREMRLLDRAENGAGSGGRGSTGLTATAQALAAGRVQHLLLAPDELPAAPTEELIAALAPADGLKDLPTAELLIERAIETDARVTPVEAEAADRLGDLGGVAAILRY